MDDARFQRSGIMAFAADHIDFQVVPAIVDSALRNQSSSVLLPPAQDQRVMIIGGGPADDRTSATGITEIVQLDQPNPAYQLAMPLSLPRIHLNAVLLPDRTVFVSGGAIFPRKPVSHLSPSSSRDLRPGGGYGSPEPGRRHPRMYHSVAHAPARWPSSLRAVTRGHRAPGSRLTNEELQIGVLLAIPVWRRAPRSGRSPPSGTMARQPTSHRRRRRTYCGPSSSAAASQPTHSTTRSASSTCRSQRAHPEA